MSGIVTPDSVVVSLLRTVVYESVVSSLVPVVNDCVVVSLLETVV